MISFDRTGETYIPLQLTGEFQKDCDVTLETRYGKRRVVVRDCKIVFEEYFNNKPENFPS